MGLQLAEAVEERDAGNIAKLLREAQVCGLPQHELDTAQEMLLRQTRNLMAREIDDVRFSVARLASSVAGAVGVNDWEEEAAAELERRVWNRVDGHIGNAVETAVRNVVSDATKELLSVFRDLRTSETLHSQVK